jgi:hypothetical protein
MTYGERKNLEEDEHMNPCKGFDCLEEPSPKARNAGLDGQFQGTKCMNCRLLVRSIKKLLLAPWSEVYDATGEHHNGHP